MSGSLPWGPANPMPPAGNNPNDTLLRIERNTAELLRWMKVLVVILAIAVILSAFLFV